MKEYVFDETVISPCKGCDDCCIGCDTTCGDYAIYKSKIEENRAKSDRKAEGSEKE